MMRSSVEQLLLDGVGVVTRAVGSVGGTVWAELTLRETMGPPALLNPQ